MIEGIQAHLLDVSERIFYGIRDHDTIMGKYLPLWQHPVLLDSFIHMLRRVDDETYARNFENVCALLCPDFLMIMDELHGTKYTIETKVPYHDSPNTFA